MTSIEMCGHGEGWRPVVMFEVVVMGAMPIATRQDWS
jgi:hypothetical protein